MVGESNRSAAHVQTKTEIEAALSALGMSPRKRFGQNFLIDGNLMRRLAASGALNRDDLVVEVGGGTGGLTDLLAAEAGAVIVVEVDRDLQTFLSNRFAEKQNVRVVAGDALQSKHELHTTIQETLRQYRVSRDGAAKLVANLPYQVATPLIMNLLIDFPQVSRLCFTVQKEVGQRLLAKPGSKDYGPLSVVAQLTSEIKVIARLPPHVFWPKPRVESIMLEMSRKAFGDELPPMPSFARFVRGTFDHRRKTLRRALTHVVDTRIIDSICAEFNGDQRPEAFAPDAWTKMFDLTC